MKKIKLLILCLGLIAPTINAQQITTDTGLSLEDLVEGLLGTECVETSNIASPHNGAVNGLSSYGGFTSGSSNFPFSNGVVLTTGDVISSGNGFISTPLNDGTPAWGTDMDLENTLNISNTLNATTLEFEFVSAVNTIQFNYILASEEYQQEYPCFYSDGFAILIKRAGTSDNFINIAKIPGTNINVNTNTIHDTIEGFCEASNEEYFEGYNIGDTNYNGRTTVLTATASIEPNTPYLIKFIIADDTNEQFDSAVFIEGNSFNATVDLGPDIMTCASEIILNADTGNDLSIYEWFLNGNAIVSSSDPTLSVDESGDYRVVVSSPLGSGTCVLEDSITVTIDQEQSTEPISDIEVCDDPSNDGVEIFDLNNKLSELLDAVVPATYTVLYFETSEDAINNTNSIDPLYQNNTSPQTIYVRMEDSDTGCLAFPTFDLIVNPLPTAVSIPPFLACQNQVEEEITSIDLSTFDASLSENNPNIVVSYHATLNDAVDNIAPLSIPYDNPNVSETIYVRLENIITGCTNTTSFDITFQQALDIPSAGAFIDLCIDPNEQFDTYTYDLTSVVTDLLNGLTDVTVTYHQSYSDAEQGINPISNPANYQNDNPNVETIYIRFEDDSSQCPTISAVELHVNLLNNAFSDVFTSDICDDSSNDGVADFDLQIVKEEVAQGFLNLNIELYANETDLLNQTNPLDDSLPFQVIGGQDIIYAELTSENCSTTIEVTLLINNATRVDPVSIEYCDDSINDGITEIILADLDQETLQGIDPGTVSYFYTMEDAENNDNVIGGSIFNTSNPQRLYVRIENTNTDCSAVTYIDVSVINTPDPSVPTPLTICDLDGNGVEQVDLTSKEAEIISSPTGLSFSYFLSLEDAESDLNPILNSTNFQTETDLIYVKVSDDMTQCFEVVVLEVFVNTSPVISNVSPFVNCATTGTDVADFILSEKDDEILNGQSDKRVLYFLNPTDASTGNNPLDSSLSYQNNSNPQTIYYRIENETDTNCFNTGNFELSVRPLPVYSQPSDIFVCNDNVLDNTATIDLNETILQIENEGSDNLSVSFHPTLNDAENNTNPHPLNFTNTINPEPIFARIENQEGCFMIEGFEMNVVALPLINPAPSLENCDTDYDGQISWDLTLVETEVLSIRQDNIDIEYYRLLSDLETSSNPILDPTNYINQDLEETVYIKIINTISNCYSFVPIPLRVNLPPLIEDFGSYEICGNDTSTVNLQEVSDLAFLGNTNEVTISYFNTLDDANNNTNSLPLLYPYQNVNEALYIRLTANTTGCFFVYPFQLIINEAPIPGPISDLETCDDDFDGLAAFNFSQQTMSVLTGLNPDLHTVTYYNSLDNAETDVNPLPSTYWASDQEMLFIRLQETFTGCYSIVSFTTFVRPRPNIDIPQQTLCTDVGFLTVDASTGADGETYLWSNGSMTSSIDITAIGDYSVTVTSAFGCQTTSTFEVISSESAFVDVIETVDFSDPNNIIISVSGSGDYLYSLDNGPLQESPIFENVSLGVHTVTIFDNNGCASVTRTVIVVDAPKFFTPNGDGNNDTWHITGIETIPGTSISIFDRFGKLMAILNSDSDGWNGQYNGNNMPASDYWFSANVIKNNENFKVEGHFALRR